jgi:phosphate transport system substrate-binding protein
VFLRRIAVALVASGVALTAMGVNAAATGDVAPRRRQLTPGGELHGSGASFPCGYIEQAIEDAVNDDLVVTYDCDGSGNGRAEFIQGDVDFAGSDVPLSDAERAQLAAKGVGYVQFAYVGGGITIAYNPGSGLPYNLKLSTDTIGKIFSGQIVNWDDPELARLNPGVSLPDLRLRVAARSDSSGTTNGFTSFMAQTSTSWTAGTRDVFDSPSLPAFPGLLTVEGSDGVADAVRDNPGMIGYVELSFASERRLNVAAVEGADGFVLPDTSAVTQAVAALRLNDDGTVTPSFATAPGYPLSVVTYLLVRQDNKDRQTAANLRAFAELLLSNNDKAASLAYAPLPASLVSYAKRQIATIGPGGSAPTSTTTVPAPTTTVPPATVSPEAVLPPPSTLAPSTNAPTTTPVTGPTSGPLVVLGLALIAAGLSLVRASRPHLTK